VAAPRVADPDDRWRESLGGRVFEEIKISCSGYREWESGLFLLVEGRRPLSEENKKTTNGFPDLKLTFEDLSASNKSANVRGTRFAGSSVGKIADAKR
jgi:hypothetical protein